MPISSTSSARRVRVVSCAGWLPGKTTSIGCGSNVISTVGTPRDRARLHGVADQFGVPAVHAVEHADGDDTSAPVGGDFVLTPPALHDR